MKKNGRWYKKETVCRVLKETEPEVFEAKFAELVKEAGSVVPSVQYADGYFVAVVTFEKFIFPDDEEEELTVAEEFHNQGIRYVCGQCPHLQDDGDKRRNYHPCKYSELGTAHKEHECCEYFYKQLKQGTVVPRF